MGFNGFCILWLDLGKTVDANPERKVEIVCLDVWGSHKFCTVK